MTTKIRTFLLILAMQGIPTAASAADSLNPYSAAQLGIKAGLQISETLVIGNVEQVKKGEIPLALTNPATMGILRMPGNIPASYPLPRQRPYAIEDFDSGLFYGVSRVTPALNDDAVFHSLFRIGDERYAFTRMTIRPVILTEESTTDTKGKKNRKKEPKKYIRRIRDKTSYTRS